MGSVHAYQMDITQLTSPTDAQVDRMIDLFRDSFQNEPGFRYMFQHPTRRSADVRWAAALKFELIRHKLRIFVAGESISGFSWWIPPTESPFSTFWQQVRVGYGAAPFRCGLSAFRRMYDFSSQERELVEKHTRNPVWTLDTIAVDLSQGRQGLGGQLLSPGLSLARQDELPCFVLTHNDRNVRFYQKYGFVLRQTAELGQSGVKAYCLIHPGS